MTTVWIIAGIVFGIGVLALLIYGIVTHKSRQGELEAGFLDKLTPTAGWTPLTLVVDSELSDLEDVIIHAVKEAASWWTEQTGEKYFYPPGELAAGGHVVPVQRAPENTIQDHNHAYAFVQPWVTKSTGELMGMSVNMMPGWESATYATLIEAMKHELGHCLGLAHDGYTESIMDRVVDNRKGAVSDADKKLLKETYIA